MININFLDYTEEKYSNDFLFKMHFQNELRPINS